MSHSTDPVIPPAVRLAAKRGFVRTTAQSYAATLTTGISAGVVLAVVTGEQALLPIAITTGVALLSPLLAGAASYLSILSRGVPEEYREA